MRSSILRILRKCSGYDRDESRKLIENIDPKNSFLYFWRGFAYEFLEEYQTAIKDLKIAKQYDPGFTLTTSILEYIDSKGFK